MLWSIVLQCWRTCYWCANYGKKEETIWRRNSFEYFSLVCGSPVRSARAQFSGDMWRVIASVGHTDRVTNRNYYCRTDFLLLTCVINYYLCLVAYFAKCCRDCLHALRPTIWKSAMWVRFYKYFSYNYLVFSSDIYRENHNLTRIIYIVDMINIFWQPFNF